MVLKKRKNQWCTKGLKQKLERLIEGSFYFLFLVIAKQYFEKVKEKIIFIFKNINELNLIISK